MDEAGNLSHTKWECKYHVVFIPKCRRKTLYGELRRYMGEVFRRLAMQKESRIEEAMSDSPIEIPTKDPKSGEARSRRSSALPSADSDLGSRKHKRFVIAEYSLAPFSLERGSPWLSLIDLLAKMMKEAAPKTPTIATEAVMTPEPSPKASRRPGREKASE